MSHYSLEIYVSKSLVKKALEAGKPNQPYDLLLGCDPPVGKRWVISACLNVVVVVYGYLVVDFSIDDKKEHIMTRNYVVILW